MFNDPTVKEKKKIKQCVSIIRNTYYLYFVKVVK